MSDPAVPGTDLDTFESDRHEVVSRLEQRFPELDGTVVAAVVDETARATEGAKIRSFRAVLVEHGARDRLARMTA